MTDQGRRRLPVIASITKLEQIDAAVNSAVERVNLMTGDIMKLRDIVNRLHSSGKKVFVHLEMVSGIGRDNSAVQYLADSYKIDGIITTKTNTVLASRQAGISSIQRVFAIDTTALGTAVKMIGQARPDEVELMPGLMPRVIRDLKKEIHCPLIVGGFLRSEEEIDEALANGADLVSTGDTRFWT
ncbi:glycerol-3-phosphate responsive antiterminator [Paenibacillus lautus]|uniref:glycerol-3-phosphate responsive antiterminator n=1 Tax=Paenibacillus TaxID=44249 RepID=UPI0011A8D1D1|nr:glycerol-3-phosphate responsive antiterminator [Paenibacillus sp. Y412MC10]